MQTEGSPALTLAQSPIPQWWLLLPPEPLRSHWCQHGSIAGLLPQKRTRCWWGTQSCKGDKSNANEAKDWKMTNRSQDSKEATVILPKRNMKSSTERRCESWARKTAFCMCLLYVCLRKSSSYEDPIPPAKTASSQNLKQGLHPSLASKPHGVPGIQKVLSKCTVKEWLHIGMQRCRIGEGNTRTSPYRAVLFSARRLHNGLLEGQFPLSDKLLSTFVLYYNTYSKTNK